MPDKHEVGGSSPLGPTNAQWCVVKRAKPNRNNIERASPLGISYLAESDSSTWANQQVMTCGQEWPSQTRENFVEVLNHLKEIE